MTRRAFTLIELLMVISMIVLLAALLVVAAGRMRKQSMVAKTQAIMQVIRSGLSVEQAGGWRPTPERLAILGTPWGWPWGNKPAWSSGDHWSMPGDPMAQASNNFYADPAWVARRERFLAETPKLPISRLRFDHCTTILQATGDGSYLTQEQRDLINEVGRFRGYDISFWNTSNGQDNSWWAGLRHAFVDAWGNDILAIQPGKGKELVLVSAGPNHMFDDGPRADAEGDLTATNPGYPDVTSGSRVIGGVTYTSDNILDGVFTDD